ncbi:MAG: DNA cytosine methyltransferase, partial [Desulfuromonadales bacterium]|nr:DNA cytosine methyltransferase [Desulfuromonadales bacterium]
MPLRALEFFCGIGGFATAVAARELQVVGALDQSPAALAVYRRNFPAHPAREINLEHLQAADLAAFGADFWWLSPPCQPYCARGVFRDLDDPRAASLHRLLELFAQLPEARLPQLALENVAGFARSQARDRLVRLLAERGYTLRERLLCPTDLGVPMRRPRYYLTAARTAFSLAIPPAPGRRLLADY